MRLLELAKQIVAFNREKRKHDEEENNTHILESMHLCYAIAHEHDLNKIIWGGDKAEEIPRQRKDFENNIARPLGPTYFC